MQDYKLIVRSPGRTHADNEHPISTGAEATWNAAVSVLRGRLYQEPDYDVEVSVNWRPAAVVVTREFELEREISRTRSFDALERQPKGWNVARIPAKAGIVVPKTERGEQLSATGIYHLQQFIYDCFLAVNLASPGAANFRPMRVVQGRADVAELSLSSGLMESAWIYALRNGWPPIISMDLRKVWDWVSRFDFGVRQAANIAVERALFSVLHVCAHGRDDPVALIWLSHALEALFGSPKDAIVEKLRTRICDVFEVPAAMTRDVRRLITKLYDVRSAFVHGTFKIVHPHENEVFDPAVDLYRTTFMDATDLAMALVIATLQLHIAHEWRELQFREVAEGVPFRAL